ncbi:phosphate signaling complex protein PhoU, partial [Fibrobacterota bacterium]
ANLKKKMLYFCSMVEENLTQALYALEKHDQEIARGVFEKEKRIDEYEIEIEEDCLKILALHQPVASDLRFIIATLKINNDLERIDDMAVHIVERLLSIPLKLEGMSYFSRLNDCAIQVRKMLKSGLDSLVNLDANLAREIEEKDSEVDHFHQSFFEEMKNALKRDPEKADIWLNLLFISKQLERIADHTTNIAEDVIYLIEGRIVRHSDK